jgi:ADP-ribose pyrophosphatase YjhB (NUDIX family)
MKYCSHCGHEVALSIPQGDNRPRHTCNGCETIHYQNPKIVAGCLPIYQGNQVLLCKRAIEPRYGYWTLPAGYMENQESVEAAACRETLEEANAQVKLQGLYTLTSIVHANQVQMLFLADLPAPEYSASEESLEVKLFYFDEIPWEELAFETIRNALRLYIEDSKTGHFPMRSIVIDKTIRP